MSRQILIKKILVRVLQSKYTRASSRIHRMSRQILINKQSTRASAKYQQLYIQIKHHLMETVLAIIEFLPIQVITKMLQEHKIQRLVTLRISMNLVDMLILLLRALLVLQYMVLQV
jgi:ferritin-like metal-binding protein YciE